MVAGGHGGRRLLDRAADARLTRVRVADRGRRQSQLECRRQLSQAGRAAVAQRPAVAAAAARVGCGWGTQRRRRALLFLRRSQHVCGQHPESRARHRVRVPFRAVRSGRCARAEGKSRDRAHAQGAAAGRWRSALPRLSVRLQRNPAAARLHRPSGGLLSGLRSVRSLARLSAPRARGRHDSRSRGSLQGQSLRLQRLRQDPRGLWHSVRRHLLPDPERYARQAHRHPIRRRRRGDLRWRRQRQSLQPDGWQLQLLRWHHGAQHSRGVQARHQGNRRLERLHFEAQPCLRRRPGRRGRLVRVEGFLYRRQLLSRPARSQQAAELVHAGSVGEVSGLSGADHLGVCRQGLWSGPRGCA